MHQALLDKYARLPLNRTISPEDAMFEGDKDAYFRIGLTGLHAIESAMMAALVEHSDIRAILDFGCGHGRVLRYIRANFPEASITAADILPSAAQFCGETFGAKSYVASDDFVGLDPPGSPFDLVWLGSVFTHLDHDQFDALLHALKRTLSESGLLVFTVAGHRVANGIRRGDTRGIGEAGACSIIEAFDRNSFGFAPYANWSRPWGRAIAKPAWVAGALERAGLSLVLYTERGWGGRQDVVAAKAPRAEARETPRP